MIWRHCLVQAHIVISEFLLCQNSEMTIWKCQKKNVRQRTETDVHKSLIGWEEKEEIGGRGVSLVMLYQLLQTCLVRLHLSSSRVGFVFVQQGDKFTPWRLGWAMLPLKYGLQLGRVRAGAGQTFTYPCLKAWAWAGAGVKMTPFFFF